MYTSSNNIRIGIKYMERGSSFFLYLSMSHIRIINIKIARVFSSLSTNTLIRFFLKKSRLESGRFDAGSNGNSKEMTQMFYRIIGNI